MAEGLLSGFLGGYLSQREREKIFKEEKRIEEERERRQKAAELRASLMTDIASGRGYEPALDPYGEGQMPERQYGLGEASMVGPQGGPATQQDITAPGRQMPYTDFSQIAALPAYQEMMTEYPEGLPPIIQSGLSSTQGAGREHEADVEERRAEMEFQRERERRMGILGGSPETDWMGGAYGPRDMPSDQGLLQALRPPEPEPSGYDQMKSAYGEAGDYLRMALSGALPHPDEAMPADMPPMAGQMAGGMYDQMLEEAQPRYSGGGQGLPEPASQNPIEAMKGATGLSAATIKSMAFEMEPDTKGEGKWTQVPVYDAEGKPVEDRHGRPEYKNEKVYEDGKKGGPKYKGAGWDAVRQYLEDPMGYGMPTGVQEGGEPPPLSPPTQDGSSLMRGLGVPGPLDFMDTPTSDIPEWVPPEEAETYRALRADGLSDEDIRSMFGV